MNKAAILVAAAGLFGGAVASPGVEARPRDGAAVAVAAGLAGAVIAGAIAAQAQADYERVQYGYGRGGRGEVTDGYGNPAYSYGAEIGRGYADEPRYERRPPRHRPDRYRRPDRERYYDDGPYWRGRGWDD